MQTVVSALFLSTSFGVLVAILCVVRTLNGQIRFVGGCIAYPTFADYEMHEIITWIGNHAGASKQTLKW